MAKKAAETKIDPVDLMVGRNLEALRGEMRQSDFAARVGLHVATLRRLESGEERAGKCQLQIVLRKLGKDSGNLRVFFDGRLPPKDYPSH